MARLNIGLVRDLCPTLLHGALFVVAGAGVSLAVHPVKVGLVHVAQILT
jgi:hypothetical protein